MFRHSPAHITAYEDELIGRAAFDCDLLAVHRLFEAGICHTVEKSMAVMLWCVDRTSLRTVPDEFLWLCAPHAHVAMNRAQARYVATRLVTRLRAEGMPGDHELDPWVRKLRDGARCRGTIAAIADELRRRGMSVAPMLDGHVLLDVCESRAPECPTTELVRAMYAECGIRFPDPPSPDHSLFGDPLFD